VTLFDLGAGLVLLVSGIFGYARGATREVTTAIAFVLAIVAAVLALRFTGPIAGHSIHTVWMANAAAVLIVFIFAYVVLRLIGGALTRRVRQTAALSGLDRALGFAIGVVRGLVVIGAFALLIEAATPAERRPAWIVGAKLYPLASQAGAALKSLAPRGLNAAHAVAPEITGPAPGDTPPQRKLSHGRGYSLHERKSLDDLVEKSR